MCSLKGLNTGLRADAAQGKGCVQEEIFMSRSAKNDKTKTNVMRLLDAAKIPYEAKEYPVDENDLSGSHAADMLGVDHGSVFKTLVLKGERTGFLVCCIPVARGDSRYCFPRRLSRTMWEQNCWICSKMVNINEKVIGNHLKVGNQYLTKL